MAKKTETKNEKTEAESRVYDLAELFQMRFIDPTNGAMVMVRKAFKPRGKLEFYCPENKK